MSNSLQPHRLQHARLPYPSPALLAQTHVCRVDDAIQPSYPLPSPSLPAFNLSQHQSLFPASVSLTVISKFRMCLLSRFSHVQLFVTLWMVAGQAPVSMGYSRQEYWSGLPCPPPGDLPNPGIKAASQASPALKANSLLLSHQGSPKG